MKVYFLTAGDPQLSVNRIYIENMARWLSKYCEQIGRGNIIESGYDVYICSKYSDVRDIKKLRNKNPNSIIGIVHPSDANRHVSAKMLLADFFLVGSIEEHDYYNYYCSNIFRFPQIEEIDVKRRVHCDRSPLLIGYHGNLEHLNESSRVLKSALERLHKNHPIKMIVVYNQQLGKWKKGKPNVPIEFIDWTFDNMVREMSKVDVGIVPCVNDSFLDRNRNNSGELSKIIKRLNGRVSDYSLQFKNNANNGRALVFHQLGIPVVADFWPCHFEILSSEENGYLAHSEESWYLSLSKLANSSEIRQSTANNAYEVSKLKYDPLIWAKKFYEYLKKISK